MGKNNADLATMARAPVEVEAKGKTYKLTPIGLKQLGELQQWAKEQIQANGMAQINQIWQQRKVPDEAKQKLTEQLMDRIEAKCNDANAIGALLSSPEGALRALLVAFRAHHPDMKQEEMDAIVDEYGLQRLNQLFERINGDDDSEAKEAGN